MLKYFSGVLQIFFVLVENIFNRSLAQDLLVCEYCDQGVHFSCLQPRPDKRPKVGTVQYSTVQYSKVKYSTLVHTINILLIGS